MTGLYMCDGSGRSHDNIASPKQLGEVLFKMTFHPFSRFLQFTSVGRHFRHNAQMAGRELRAGRIRAKTGSLGVSEAMLVM